MSTMKKPCKLAKTVMIVGKLRVRFHVKFDSDAHKEYDFNQKTYTSLSHMSFITLENMDGSPNDINRSVMITDKNIFSVIAGLNSIKNKLYKDGLYYYENKKLMVYADVAKECVVKTTLYGAVTLAYIPAVVYYDNTAYEGIYMVLNDSHSVVQLTLDELEALLYCLSKIDFFLYSQSMVNYFIYYYKVDTDTVSAKDVVIPKTPKANIDWTGSVKTEAVANFRRGEDDFDKLFNPQ